MIDQIVRLNAEGKSQRAIAAELGVSVGKVNKVLKAQRSDALPSKLAEALHAAQWIEGQEGCFWTSAVSESMGRDADAPLKGLQERGLIRYLNRQCGEAVYTISRR